ncbi:hypothetical protein ECTW09098_2370, partial [Escherichia coli TW09098]
AALITTCARSRFSNFLISVAALRVFFLKIPNIVTFLWVGEPTPGSDLPTEKVTLTTP